MSYLPAVLLFTSAIMQSVGAIQEAKAQQEAMEYNARLAEMQAEVIRRKGEERERQIEVQKEVIEARQRVLYAKAGVSYAGTPFEVMMRSAEDALWDKVVNDYNTQVGMWQQENQAQMYRYYGKVYRQQGLFKAGTTLLTAGAEIGMRFPKKPNTSSTIEGGKGGQFTGYQSLPNINQGRSFPTWSPYGE